MKRNFITTILAGLFLLMGVGKSIGQTPGEEAEQWASWWFGVYGGVNYSTFSGELRNFGSIPGSSFTEGSGLGPTFGGLFEYNPGKLLGFTMMVGYDGRPVGFDSAVTPVSETASVTEGLSTSLSYLSVEPSLRLNLGNRFFHLLLGPTFNFNLGKGSEYTTVDTNGAANTTTSDLVGVRGFAIGAQGGVGYDIPLTSSESSTQILLTPFAQFHLGFQNLLENPANEVNRNLDYTINTIRAGIQLKFGARPTSPVITDANGNPIAYDFRVNAPTVVAESRRVEETFPLRNYIFFDPGSTALPSRYKKLSSAQAGSFREEQLLNHESNPNPGTGVKQRSQRQMEVYYNALNVFGDRMKRNPSARITLTGSANGDAAKGKEMAENVKSYLVSTFGLDASRITTKGSDMPPHKSGSGGSSGEDKALIDAENWRVELDAEPPSILMPVEIVTLEEEPIGNDVIFKFNSDDRVESASVAITERDGTVKTFGPYRGDQDVRIDANELLGGTEREGRYTAKTVYVLKDGGTFESQSREFRLVRADPDEQQTGVRYSILFEFDKSKTVTTYEQFLRETVAPAIPNGSNVIIHGHTDVIGKPEYNNELSDSRVDEARRILTDALTKLGRKVTFDSYGFGEDEKRAPFGNGQPEQRYYNRTVVIEIVPGG
ncbi:MAG: outer membrane beta-barrel protein [Candidatus Kapaibacterium sp.]